MRPAFTGAQLASYRSQHTDTLLHRCDVRRRGAAVEVGGYVQDAEPLSWRTDVPCQFNRIAPGQRRIDPTRDDTSAQPVLYVDVDAGIQRDDQVGAIRDETGRIIVAGWLEVVTVTPHSFSAEVVLREVTV